MKPGWVWTGNCRPFERWEEVIAGKNKGHIKVWLTDKTIIVPKENIKTWPLDIQSETTRAEPKR